RRGQRGCHARTSAAREVANTARRRARTSAVRSKCSSGQYGEPQRPHGLREVQGRKQPIRRGGACPVTVGPPRRARPCSYASYPGWTSPRASSPPASPSFPMASATPRRLRGCPAQGWRFWQLCSDDAVKAQIARFQHEEEDDLKVLEGLIQ
uniref:Uncharacterized protein n=2 Tax=Aegilops tauschii subsp. strangulata TaxID=200361 RepID=A0A453EGQ5_AEGTS